MDVSVLYTFIDQFKYLWQSGQDATLTVDTRAGQASIRLKVQLGQAGPLHHQKAHPQAHRDSPAQRRRRERRARDREEKATAEAAQIVPNEAEEVDDLIVSTVEAAVQVVAPKPSTLNAAVQATPLYENKAAQANILCPQPHTAVTAQATQHGEHRPAAPPPTFPWTSPVMVEDMVCPDLDYERELIIDNERETERQRNVNRTLQMIEDALNYSNR